jgi:phytoene desaturase
MVERNKRGRVAVIGSGFGGLAAAIRLQHAGFDTVVYEARDKPGGRAYVYEDQGFVFDAGPTVITAPQCFEELFELTGRKLSDYVELLPVAPFYRLAWDDGTRFDYEGDTAAMLAQIKALSPEDADGYLRFVDYAKRVFDIGYTELVDQPFLRFTDMVKVAPDLIRLRADRSVYDVVSRFVKNEHLRQALSFHSLLVGGNPFDTSSIYTLIHYLEKKWGVHFPRGGTGALVRALVRLLTELGGTLLLSSPVRAIRLEQEQGRTVHVLEFDHGPEQRFDLVVSNADVHHTYADLLKGSAPAKNRAQKLSRMQWSMSLFVLYFGTNRTYHDEVVHHTVLFGRRYRELLREIFKGPGLPDDFSLYLHAPTRTDPSMAPPGCEAFYVLSPVPHLGSANLDWESIAPGYAERILGHLQDTLLPDLKRHIVTQRWLTPQGFQRDLRAYQGSAFSCAPTLTQSAWFRPHNRDPEIAGLYLVGAGTHPGAGLPGVVNSAKATARVIMEDFA